MRISRSVLAYKLRALAASFSVFLVFAIVLAFLSYRFWYPDYLFRADGGLQGLKLIYAVDFVLGPVLALVFFHPEKSRPKLVFDIVVIAAVQLSAMAWGTWQVYKQRPVAVVYGSQRFISVAPAIMARQQKSPADLQAYSDARPPFVYRREPANEKEKQRMIEMLFQAGFHFESQAWLFQPFLPNREKIFDRESGMHEFLQERLAQEWKAWVAGQERQAMSDYRFAFYEGRYENAVLVFDPEGRYLDWLPLGTMPIPDIKPALVSR